MSRLMNALFGCSHKHYTFPRTVKPGQRCSRLAGMTGTYVVCLDCGKEFAYDWQEMKVIASPKTAPAAGATEAA